MLIERLDPSVFVLNSQTTRNDRISLLRLQCCVRRLDEAYCYLEIGSHLGGSLLPHLADPRCAWAISIDPRPPAQPDERGRVFAYAGNATGRMIEGLRAHLPDTNLRKLQTVDLDARDVPRSRIERPVQLALIDGEHTNVAAFSDFISVFSWLADDAVVAFHDSHLIIDAIRNAERFLTHAGIPFRSVFLPDCVAAIGLRDMGGALAAATGEVALDRTRFEAGARRGLQETLPPERKTPMLKPVFELVEFYVSYRILSAAMTVFVALCLLIFPTWFLTYIAVGTVIFLVACIPFVVLWAVIVFFGTLRRSGL